LGCSKEESPIRGFLISLFLRDDGELSKIPILCWNGHHADREKHGNFGICNITHSLLPHPTYGDIVSKMAVVRNPHFLIACPLRKCFLCTHILFIRNKPYDAIL